MRHNWTEKTKWEYVAEGYATKTSINNMTIEILLHVGHGIPGHWDNVAGYADLSIHATKEDMPSINERITFSSHPDYRGDIVGEFFYSDGIQEDTGETWEIGHTSLIDSATMEDGDERNDDAMKTFLEGYIKTLVYADELKASQEEGFGI